MGLEGDAEGMAGGRGGLGERGMSTRRKKCLEGKMRGSWEGEGVDHCGEGELIVVEEEDGVNWGKAVGLCHRRPRIIISITTMLNYGMGVVHGSF